MTIRVSAVMPVLNGAKTIDLALRDLRAQTLRDIEIVVCDNASTDATPEIVRCHAADDARVRYLRFEEKVDIIHSFRRAYGSAAAPVFFFAAADDRWYPEFAEAALAVLDAHPEAVACSPRIAFTRDGKFSHVSSGTRPLVGEAAANVADYLREPAENARAFGLIRHAALEGCFPPAEYPGWDYQMMARSLSKGGHHLEIPSILAERDTTSYAAYIRQAERFLRNPVALVVPLHRLAWHVLRDPAIARSWRLVAALGHLMLVSHRNYSAERLPRWARLMDRVLRPMGSSAAEIRPSPRPLGLKGRGRA